MRERGEVMIGNDEVINHSDTTTDEVIGERKEVMLTTTDNPFDYFTQFKQWYMFDMEKGYNTCGYLARVIDSRNLLKDDMTQREEDAAIEQAIDEIFIHNPLNIYKKIERTVAY